MLKISDLELFACLHIRSYTGSILRAGALLVKIKIVISCL